MKQTLKNFLFSETQDPYPGTDFTKQANQFIGCVNMFVAEMKRCQKLLRLFPAPYGKRVCNFCWKIKFWAYFWFCRKSYYRRRIKRCIADAFAFERRRFKIRKRIRKFIKVASFFAGNFQKWSTKTEIFLF